MKTPHGHLRWLAVGAMLAACTGARACSPHAETLGLLAATKLDLPKVSQITQAWSCKDAKGDQLVLVAHAPESLIDGSKGEELLFVKYRQTAKGWKKDWQARDFLASSRAPGGRPPTQQILIGDYDGDGLADIFIAYVLPGQPLPPDEGKLLVYYKDQKYAIRGAIARTPNDFGSRKISVNFLTLPAAIQTQALQLWDKLNTPRP